MATKRKPTLLALLICEKTILEEDKVATLFRVIDTFTIKAEVVGMTENEVSTMEVLLECWVFTKWGLGEGQFTEEFGVLFPDGTELKSPKGVSFVLSGFKFQQTRARVAIRVRESGMYSFRIYLDGELEREHPFKVNLDKLGVELPQAQG